ncbi:bifunctional UDP-sugar hydrolase/5'-nucleotidase [Streptomyces sp. UH6]|uniref:bifunctional metallophosphatase/5'-nucleotidase n=1 Tax=Streptomyces sp. UH6 TaxID=2748379 RepID=UPI0015D4AFDA|nr:bifunctional metallophosphatase/5'-nucleotidase [Streptomyces sp. UH6]NYV74595.1 bifunctional metallophosphatase/5'-nucleotidase [Streptomyces sp. UH6]
MPRITRQRRTHRILIAGAALTTVGALTAALPAEASGQGHGPKPRTVDVQLLSFNDLHGNLEPPTGSSARVTEVQPDGTVKTIEGVGGVEYLAASLRTARKGEKYSVTAAAGDLIGASPLLSGLFHDEPTVEALNKLDLDVSGVGNHEFDEGLAELKRMRDGGCHPTDGCYTDKPFKGADFPYLGANVTLEDTGRPALAPYWVWKHGSVKIGFIGVTLENTPGIVTAEGVEGLEFHDEVETINKYADELNRQGVKSVVALVHEGGVPANGAYNHLCDAQAGGISGPIVDIAKNVSPKVDALVTGHTHNAYVCDIPDPAGNSRMVTSAASFGRLYTDTTLTYDLATEDIVRTAVDSANHVVSRAQDPAGDISTLIKRWRTLSEPVANRPIGYITGDISKTGTESPLGDLIADAQLHHARGIDPDTAFALMNPGGVRADLTYAASGEEGDGVVTYGEGFTVQPFSNTVNLADLTGADIVAALQQQVSGGNAAAPKILQVSEGLTYTLDMTKTGADRVVADSIRIQGQPVDLTATYRVAMNNFLAGGGDNFPALAKGTDPVVGSDDLTAFADYLTATSSPSSPIVPPAADRITIVG